jgi:hypothetical protein
VDQATEKVNVPSILLRVLGLLFAVFAVTGMFWQCMSPIMQILSSAIQAGTAPDEDAMIAALIAGLFGSTFAIVMACVQILFGFLGLVAGIVSFISGGRLGEFRSRNLVQAGAVLIAVQPVIWLLTSCCTSSCGICGFFVWIPLSVLGIVTAVMVFGALGDPDVDAAFAKNDGEV